MPLEQVTITFTAIASDREALAGGAMGQRLYGWSARESTGSASASLVLRDGNNALRDPLFYVNLAAGASDSHWTWPGVPLRRGLFITVASGQADLTIFYVRRVKSSADEEDF